MILLSTYLNIGNKLNSVRAFDQILDLDANYFININRVKDTNIKEFKNGYKKINDYFKNIGLLLKHSKGQSDRFYKEAIKKINFHEVNEIGLGYSKGRKGSGFGKELTQKIINDAKVIIDAGTKDPEIFHLIVLFEDNVGPDRLSDMFATLLEDEIKQYTKRIYKELGINKENYPELEFEGEFLINPYKENIILLLPQDILHELPIAKDWDDIDRVCREIEKIKNDINTLVKKNWSKIGSTYKKSYIRENIINDKVLLNKLINEYKESKVEEYDFEKDPLGLSVLAVYQSKLNQEDLIEDIDKDKTTFQITKDICERFKYQIENKKASQILYTDDLKPRKEKIAQQLFLCIADAYCKANNLDLSPECNIGRGPVDFKTSKGDKDKTLVEIKLTTNSGQLVHGLKVQLEEYSKAEETKNLIYLVIDNGGSKNKIKEMYEVYDKFADDKKKPFLIFVDAIPKASASKY
ncbi:hypothetical protein [Clostridium beijerinckii]|uniref:hypothetical protein n=1 Tax=Clostridium beijerinckii TaxID=1520 RepID=UPI00098C8AB2|nr:hypothetical protein [Clostridium beijerinckii]NRU38926.1 hypothetical protein [Clostridium beijerinckii]NSA97795.1 hypothetical protein [Clostridium beijerinckii]OOM68669.1 hypothetical protein CLOBI_02240 [Clostridium beijerinckii]OOM72622.1 hypothetical protein CLBEIC_06310 [Clostridium beijerinckii]CUU48425.1 conserved protein of unknown function [Clostridium beijerinckii]